MIEMTVRLPANLFQVELKVCQKFSLDINKLGAFGSKSEIGPHAVGRDSGTGKVSTYHLRKT